MSMEQAGPKLTRDNYEFQVLRSRARQAGVSLIYDPERDEFTYNAYCLELKLLKELFTQEFETLDEALSCIHEEFGSWQLADAAVPLPSAAGCGGCCGSSHRGADAAGSSPGGCGGCRHRQTP
jgi:hypothetical protein